MRWPLSSLLEGGFLILGILTNFQPEATTGLKPFAMKNYFVRFKDWLAVPVDAQVLGVFRIIYGLFMTYEMTNYIQIGLIRQMFFLPAINFKYDFLRWLTPLPEVYMDILLYLLLVCALFIAAGFLFKWAARFFALGYAYIFLIDKSIFNNHIYLFILLAIMLSLTNADEIFSVKSLMKRRKGNTDTPGPYLMVPRWQPFVFQAHMIIVYFYGGITKITYDWLFRQEPVRSLLDQMQDGYWMAPFIKNEFGVHLLTYGGFLIDILSPLLLWYKPVRNWAVIPFIGFHFSNTNIFHDIGIFPFIMMLSLVLFFEPDEIPFLKKLTFKSRQNALGPEGSGVLHVHCFSTSLAVKRFLMVYFTFQLLFPFRGHFMPNDLDWTTIGNRFAWRMKVDTRELVEMNFFLTEGDTSVLHPVEIRNLVNDMQMLNLYMDPRSIADFGRVIKRLALERGMKNPKVHTTIQVRYNGRPPQYFVDPGVDISSVTYSPFKLIPWVYPIKR